MQETMEKILKDFMQTKCVSMHNTQFMCYGKGCDGHCQMFVDTLMKLKDVQQASK
jgi:hypothetical protein